jgi:hypothetical protein
MLRIEIDENGKKWIECDFCGETELDFNEDDSEVELNAAGWEEINDKNHCPVCLKWRKLIREILFEEVNKKCV